MKDDFDLRKIEESGQCFRVKEIQFKRTGQDSGLNGDFEPVLFRFITGDEIVYISTDSDLELDFIAPCIDGATCSCNDQKWQEVWNDYFDLDRDYRAIRESVPANDTYMKKAAECGEGIRILKQDPWEMMISFIISQRKSIPAIKTSIEMICERFGRKIETCYETVFTFPSAEEIVLKAVNNTENDIISEDCHNPKELIRKRFSKNELLHIMEDSALKECKLGYRLKYICDAVCRVIYDEIDLDGLRSTESDELLLKLKEVYGVGDKVANCIALFSYGRCELAPVDTWIKKVIEQVYAGNNPFPAYGSNAGIMQQYIFYYALKHKDEF